MVDLAFAIDSSGSVNRDNPNNWDTLLQFVQDFVGRFTVGPNAARVAAVPYSNRGNTAFNLSSYDTTNDVNNAIKSIPYKGGTSNTAHGIQIVNTEVFQSIRGDRAGVTDIAIIIMDGRSSEGAADVIPQATAAKARGIRLVVVGVTQAVDLTELTAIASRPGDVVTIDSFGALSGSIDRLYRAVCSDGAPGPTPATTPVPTPVPTPGPTPGR